MATHIRQLLQQWGYDFQPGRHNEYVLHFSTCCLKYGINMEEAMQVRLAMEAEDDYSQQDTDPDLPF